VGEKVGVFTTRMDQARHERLWRENPQLRRLVPKSRCPYCHHRLEPKYDNSSSSEDEEPFTRYYQTPNAPHTSLAQLTEQRFINDGEQSVVRFVDKLEDETLETPTAFHEDTVDQTEPKVKIRIPAFKEEEGGSADEFNFNQRLSEDRDIMNNKHIDKSLSLSSMPSFLKNNDSTDSTPNSNPMPINKRTVRVLPT